MTFLKMDQLLLNHSDKNYEDDLAYVFNVCKDDIDPMQVRTEAFSMSTMFQGSNCTNFSVILERLESLHPTKHALIPNKSIMDKTAFLYHVSGFPLTYNNLTLR